MPWKLMNPQRRIGAGHEERMGHRAALNVLRRGAQLLGFHGGELDAGRLRNRDGTRQLLRLLLLRGRLLRLCRRLLCLRGFQLRDLRR
jgi:hypothetical protein